MERRTKAPWAAGFLLLATSGVVGYGTQRLSREARRTCALVLREHPSIFDFWTWEAPLTVIVMALVGLAAWALPATVLRQAPRPVRLLIPAAVFTLTLATLVLLHFVWLGTPIEGASESPEVCTEDHVPPWWPRWLPA